MSGGGRQQSTGSSRQSQPTVHNHRTPAQFAGKWFAVHGRPTCKPGRGASKIGMLVQTMRARHGASIEQLANATGWQHHSVRGAISGTIKKKLGLTVTSVRVNDTRVYRIAK